VRFEAKMAPLGQGWEAHQEETGHSDRYLHHSAAPTHPRAGGEPNKKDGLCGRDRLPHLPGVGYSMSNAFSSDRSSSSGSTSIPSIARSSR
jgi:hypothetical protein